MEDLPPSMAPQMIEARPFPRVFHQVSNSTSTWLRFVFFAQPHLRLQATPNSNDQVPFSSCFSPKRESNSASSQSPFFVCPFYGECGLALDNNYLQERDVSKQSCISIWQGYMTSWEHLRSMLVKLLNILIQLTSAFDGGWQSRLLCGDNFDR